jgi:class 3 adenylate cyclase
MGLRLKMDTVTFLFTDIEGSTRMWEEDPGRMAVALARHDELVRRMVGAHRGIVVKTTGDGAHAAFREAHQAVGAALRLQQALASPESTDGLTLRVRCGVHQGVVERRDSDYFGTAVNRAARIMCAAHGGQVLLSAAVAERVAGKLPPGAASATSDVSDCAISRAPSASIVAASGSATRFSGAALP